MKAADIPMGEILLFLEKQTRPAVHWSMRAYVERKNLPPSILDALPTIVEREHRRFPEDLQDMFRQQERMKREQDADFEAWKARNPKKESAA